MNPDISIHALREEGDIRFRPVSTTHCNFYPRPPRGGRQQPEKGMRGIFKFLSTPSARRATLAALHVASRDSISIHALREEGDPPDLFPRLFQSRT